MDIDKNNKTDIYFNSPEDEIAFLNSVEGEITFFHSLMRARPVGPHRHFHALSMRTAIHHDTGKWVSVDSIWVKARELYDLEALDKLVRQKLSNTAGRCHPFIPRKPTVMNLPAPAILVESQYANHPRRRIFSRIRSFVKNTLCLQMSG